jgi:hypothetical protein
VARARTLVLKTQVEVTGADKLNNLGKKMQTVGRNLTVGVTLPWWLPAGHWWRWLRKRPGRMPN